jgi:hypothetical protein
MATTTATLNALVNPRGSATMVTFVYDIDPTLLYDPKATTAQLIGDGTNGVVVSAAVSGLIVGTRIYFGVKATSAAGTTYSAILSFETLSNPVSASAATGAATTVTTSTATLNALVNPQGSATTVRFVYGTDPTLATGTTTTAQLIGNGTNDVAVTAALTGLPAGTMIYDRVEATSSAGTTLGDILAFQTLARLVIDGPSIQRLERVGAQDQPTRLLLTFDRPLNADTGQTLANYKITGPKGRVSRVVKVTYDAATQTVLLTLAERLKKSSRYGLVVVGTGPTGVKDTSGLLLDGARTGEPGSDYSATVPNTYADGPTVRSLQRFESAGQVTRLVLTASRPLDTASAQTLANYKLTDPRRHVVPVMDAAYDPATRAVTLTISQKLSTTLRYRLMVVGKAPRGLRDLWGSLLDGLRNGRPGSNYTSIVPAASPMVAGQYHLT